jgi:hypothetical protein
VLTFKPVLRAALPALLVSLTACATIEDGADHARDFVHAHPVVTAVAAAAIGAGVAAAVHAHKHRQEPPAANPCAYLSEPHGDVLQHPCAAGG